MRKYLVFLLILVLACSLAEAVSIGVSPGRINFNNVLKGGYAERSLTISSSYEGNLTAHYETYGDIADWLRFYPENESIVVSRSRPFYLGISVHPPDDVPNGLYTGKVRILTDHLGTLSDGSGSVVRAAVLVNIAVEIVGDEIRECRGGGVVINDAEVGLPLEIKATYINDGNVILTPEISIDIWDRNQKNLLLSRTLAGEDVLPTTQKSVTYIIRETGLSEGQYWAKVSMSECGISHLTTFDIVSRGEIADKGKLVSVSAKTWNFVDDTIPIKVHFINLGSRFVTAKFMGSVMLGSKIVHVIESDPVEVLAGEQHVFEEYFVPKQSGRYEVKGRIHYNNKITYERSAIINVNPKPAVPTGQFGFKFGIIFLYIAIIAIILILFNKIRGLKRR